MQRHIVYIINPISGTGDKDSIRNTLASLTEAAGIAYSMYPSVASGDYSFLEPLIEERRVTDIVIAGGDGTINSVVSHLRKFDVRFGIIPSGSGNGLAYSAGIPKNIERAWRAIEKGKSKPIDAFLINDQFACMLCGLGLDAQVAHDFADAPKRGLLTYVQKTIADFIKAPSYSFKLKMHSKEFRTKAFFISIANSNQFGNNFTIAPKASLTDGLLDIVVMTKQNKLSALLNTLKQISGYNPIRSVEMINENSSLIYFQTDKIRISNPDAAPMHIDGDPVESPQKIEINVLKSCFRLMYP